MSKNEDLPTEHLPANLAALEARLAALRPSEVQLDRDGLLYEAGFEAGLRSIAPSVTAGIAPRVALASLASAAMAACVAVFVTRAVLVPATSPETEVQIARAAEESSDVKHSAPDESSNQPMASAWERPKGDKRVRVFKTKNSMLALRDSILSGEEMPMPDETPLTSVNFDPPKTARQLRAELLPNREVELPTSNWHWFKQFSSQGETI